LLLVIRVRVSIRVVVSIRVSFWTCHPLVQRVTGPKANPNANHNPSADPNPNPTLVQRVTGPTADPNPNANPNSNADSNPKPNVVADLRNKETFNSFSCEHAVRPFRNSDQ